LRVLLAPLGKEVVFASESGPEARPLLVYLAEHNDQVSTRLAAVQKVLGEQSR